MIDPLTAIGATASILQLVETGFQAVRVLRDIYKNGKPSGDDALAYVTDDVNKLSSSIKQSLILTASTTNLSEDDKALESLAVKCTATAGELSSILQTLQRPPGANSRWSKTFHLGWKNYRQRHNISRIENDLAAYRDEMNTRVLDILRKRLDIVVKRDNVNYEDLKRSLQPLTDTLETHKAHYSHHFDTLNTISMRIFQCIRTEHEETRRCIDEAVEPVKTQQSLLTTNLENTIANFAKKQHVELERMLKPLNMRKIHKDRNKMRLNGTCSWILKQSTFNLWKDSQDTAKISDRILCISGLPGCGKSFLSSYVVDHMERNGPPTISFAFSSLDTRSSSTACMLRTLLWQTLEIFNDSNRPSTVDLETLMMKGDPPASELLDMAIHFISGVTSTVCCIVDGIDECDDQEALKSLLSISEACPNLKLLVLGRQHTMKSSFSTMMDDAPQVEIEPEMLGEDMKIFVSHALDNAQSSLGTLEDRQEVQMTLETLSDGMFLWVKLITEEIQKSSSKAELSMRLKNLPRGLENTYRSILSTLVESLDKYELALVQDILNFLAAAPRSVTFNEVSHMSALQTRSKETQKQDISQYLLISTTTRLLQLCSGLVALKDGNLTLTHSSVKDFLTRSEKQWSGEKDVAILEFRVDLNTAHTSLFSCCLDFLELDDRRLTCEASSSQVIVTESQAFYSYVVAYILYHLNRCGTYFITCVPRIMDILGTERGSYLLEGLLMTLAKDPSLEFQIEELFSLVNLINDAGPETIQVLETCMVKIQEHWKHIDEFKPNIAQSSEASEYVTLEITENLSPIMEEHESSNSSKQVVKHPIAAISATRQPIKVQSAGVAFPGRFGPFVKGAYYLMSLDKRLKMLATQMTMLGLKGLVDPLQIFLNFVLKSAWKLPGYAIALIGHQLNEMGKPREGLEVLDAGIKATSSSDTNLLALLHFLRGRSLRKMKQPRDALDSFNVALGLYERRDLKSHSIQVHNCRIHKSYCYLALALYGDALQLANESHLMLKSCRKSSFTRGFLYDNYAVAGRAYYELSRYDEAIAAFKNALDYTDEHLGARLGRTQYRLGMACYKLSRYDEAIAAYKNALVYAEENSTIKPRDIQYALGNAYYKQSRFNEAIAAYKNALACAENYSTVRSGRIKYWLGNGYYKLSRYNEAIAAYQNALTDLENNPTKDHDLMALTQNNLDCAYHELSRQTKL